jgi:hypothetical protein
MIHAYLLCNIHVVSVQRKLMGIASRIKDVSGKSASIIDNANFITKAILTPGL